MSGLSARTYSCGGEGDRFRGGGDGSLGGSSDSLGKNLKIPEPVLDGVASLSSSSSSSEGAGDRDDNEESSEDSSSAAMLGRLCSDMGV